MSEFWSKLSGVERKLMRDEMLHMAMSGIKRSNPTMRSGAVRVKASKFVEDAIQKEMRHNGKINSINPQGNSDQ